MDKKDIYEHLAKIYLDASQKKKKKSKKHWRFKNLFFIGIAFFFGLALFLSINSINNRKKAINSEFALVIQPNIAKVNFNFDPAKKEIYSIYLKNLDVAKFKAISFSVKKASFKGSISLRVEFTNSFKEKSEIYLKDISHKWKDYRIPLSDFKNIKDWSRMSSLAFIVEEWNAKEDHNIVYIDNIVLLR